MRPIVPLLASAVLLAGLGAARADEPAEGTPPEPAEVPTSPAASASASAASTTPAPVPAVPASPSAAPENKKAPASEESASSTAALDLGGMRASFPLLDGADPLRVEGHISVIGQYVLSVRNVGDAPEWFHEFELPRAQARLDASFEGATARVLIEAVRSASGGSLIGVAGDSLVLRLREAWAAYTAWGVIETRVGLVPTLSVGPIEHMAAIRPVLPIGLERTGLLSPADLGATVRGLLPKGFGFIGAGAYNGEGYAQRELNRGKNMEIAAVIHPFAWIDDAAPFTLQGSYTSGSSGTGLARSDRVTASLGWEGDVLRGGATMGYAWGVDGAGETESALVEGFARVRPIPRLSLFADALYWLRDTEVGGDWTATVTGGAGYFIVDPLGVFLAVDGQLFGDAAVEALPGRDDVRLRLIAAVEL